MPPELEAFVAGPPSGTESLWNAFLALNAKRGSGGFAPSPISFQSFESYESLYRFKFSPWELDLLVELDDVVLRVLLKGKTPAAATTEVVGSGAAPQQPQAQKG